MLFEIDQAEIWKSAFWITKLVVSQIPLWLWSMIALAVCVSIFLHKNRG